MKVTIKEAESKVCPVRTKIVGDNKASYSKECYCLGTECMAFRKVTHSDERYECGLANH